MKRTSSIETDIVSIVRAGGVGVLPTDTLYGIVGSAMLKKTVERIYALRKRNKEKPMIVLISSLKDLEIFDIDCASATKNLLQRYWPGKVSIVMHAPSQKFRYLHRGKKTIALRMPDDEWLRSLLKKTGPLVAPSANIEGEKPAATIAQAKKYFHEDVDFYIDVGNMKSKPSTLVRIDTGGNMELLRKGAVRISQHTVLDPAPLKPIGKRRKIKID